MSCSDLSIGLVSDWLVTRGGAESVIKELLALYPHMDLYAVIDFLADADRADFLGKKAETTFIQHLPLAKKYYPMYLPLMPYAIEQLDLKEHDIIISSSHAVSKGVLTGPDQLHISYIHSPMRYVWDLQHHYLKESGLDKGIKGLVAKWFLHKMRLWDYRTANGVDYMVANSGFIARRIKKVYGRDADIIYPPVDVERFSVCENKEDFYLTASRMVPYKRIDLIVEAFSALPDKKLVVIGDGSEMKKIKSKAKSNIEILGYQNNDVLEDYMKRAKAFVFAAEEDFGITPVEAQACGTPVIAYGRGGALETVRPYGVDRPTGIFFPSQTVSALLEAISRFEAVSHEFIAQDCRSNASRFSVERFQGEMSAYVQEKWSLFNNEKRIMY
ncbi:glycosyltransferase family 4 protein [Serratia entomophila]|uniref:glycosyltransferase family 4 protein n=1 Tax=Serratia entomophila TaxID=42906 RepID=UPI00217B9D19|nr:glycosyltransferase family 4 protein [Serratia entomophila]CAI1121799.1 GDP-mannose-dependent alpha-(1-6)-phosphatidylinositol monomannoside mannosyltransferase [Serratia entomophila]CAI1832643.1 GDP-mannose-dependent alpha-(1-6)-phosphatidylinositol monomannoside mannosyltransferase [Serratia entomophila]CAI1854369.1 GDP-mannose-dependent alpha-(1-6)-phosphatidylinositol monomannoside mannosyltransferase [Serratia entomophila]CAI1902500.1 GDP-mannose-dependent alpha-(1-6)-phosphatidylinosit